MNLLDSNTAALEAYEREQAQRGDKPEQTYDDESLAIRNYYTQEYRKAEHEPLIEGANAVDWLVFAAIVRDWFSLYRSEQDSPRGDVIAVRMGRFIFSIMRKYLAPMVNK